MPTLTQEELDGYARHDGLRSMEQLAGREAKCGQCGKSTPSDGPYATLLEYCGPGSREATHKCAFGVKPITDADRRMYTGLPADLTHWRCGMTPEAHEAINPHTGRPGRTDHPFTADGVGREFDRFYCGCRGWD